jgi:hypothetical protein
MAYWLVVYILIGGAWVPGEKLEGWGPVRYDSEAECVASKSRAEAMQAELKTVNPRAHAKRYVCERRP